ncbi:hypothetical protein SAMN02799626_04793 [Caulobacter sp. UNC279MFTsu5.1]|nr:hypothetical protein SAMN02799626_04793 [Caulobacter sp. UNC279MFTsu5.1]
MRGLSEIKSRVRSFDRARLLQSSTPHPTPAFAGAAPSRKGRGGPGDYFASSYVAETSIRTFSSPAETGLLSAAISRLAMAAYIGIGGAGV